MLMLRLPPPILLWKKSPMKSSVSKHYCASASVHPFPKQGCIFGVNGSHNAAAMVGRGIHSVSNLLLSKEKDAELMIQKHVHSNVFVTDLETIEELYIPIPGSVDYFSRQQFFTGNRSIGIIVQGNKQRVGESLLLGDGQFITLAMAGPGSGSGPTDRPIRFPIHSSPVNCRASLEDCNAFILVKMMREIESPFALVGLFGHHFIAARSGPGSPALFMGKNPQNVTVVSSMLMGLEAMYSPKFEREFDEREGVMIDYYGNVHNFSFR